MTTQTHTKLPVRVRFREKYKHRGGYVRKMETVEEFQTNTEGEERRGRLIGRPNTVWHCLQKNA